MHALDALFSNNRDWATKMRAESPGFFEELAGQQAPDYLWIGCSDSRVPANQIVGLAPGELFVHRNIANVVAATDLNCLSVLQYAIDVLGVQQVMICGHYGCGGVRAVLHEERVGLADHWLRHVHDVERTHRDRLASIADPQSRLDRLCELNVIEQVRNVVLSTVVRDAWSAGKALSIHGIIYGLDNGLLRDLRISVRQKTELEPTYHAAVDACFTGAFSAD